MVCKAENHSDTQGKYFLKNTYRVNPFDFTRSFNPPSQILLKFILYILHIKTSKTAKF